MSWLRTEDGPLLNLDKFVKIDFFSVGVEDEEVLGYQIYGVYENGQEEILGYAKNEQDVVLGFDLISNGCSSLIEYRWDRSAYELIKGLMEKSVEEYEHLEWFEAVEALTKKLKPIC